MSKINCRKKRNQSYQKQTVSRKVEQILNIKIYKETRTSQTFLFGGLQGCGPWRGVLLHLCGVLNKYL